MNTTIVSRRGRAVASALAFLALVSCGGGGGGSSTPPTPPSKLFFTDGGNKALVSIVNPAPTASFNIDRVVEGPLTGLGTGIGTVFSIPSIALDAASDRMFVATNNGVAVFDNVSMADGNIPFSRHISGAVPLGGGGTLVVNFQYLALDTTHNFLYTVDPTGTVYVFSSASTSNGVFAPNRTVTPSVGPVTIAPIFGIAVDTTANDMLYVGMGINGVTSIVVYNNASTINPGAPVAPDRTLTFAQSIGSIYLDTVHDRLYAAQADGHVLVFDNASTLATGAQTADRNIDLGAAFQFYIFVDTSARNKLYAVTSNTPAQVGGLAIIDNASTANGLAPGNFFTFSPIPNIALSAIAVKP